jgi:hypothetical protein
LPFASCTFANSFLPDRTELTKPGTNAHVLLRIHQHVRLAHDGWLVLIFPREKYRWLIAGGWFVLREKYCWLVAHKPSERGGKKKLQQSVRNASSFTTIDSYYAQASVTLLNQF